MKREESANLAHANGKAHEVSIILSNIRDRASIIGSMLIFAQNRKMNSIDIALNSIFLSDEDTLSLIFYDNTTGLKKIKEFINFDKIKDIGLDKNYLSSVEKTTPFPIERVVNGEFVLLNRSENSQLPLISIGIPLFKKENGEVNYFVVIDLKQNAFQKIFSDLSERKSYLINRDGIVLAHYNDAFVLEKKSFRSSSIIANALESKIAQGAGSYINPSDNRSYFAAFSHTNLGPIVVSEIAESIILEPSLMIKREVFYMTGIVLSLSLILIFLFSLTLTRPIILLSNIARAIGRGRFDIPVARIVNSSDEVGSLASSVEMMLGGLKERDKAKSILNKFHGSSIAADLLSSVTIQRQGVRKNIAILFCDIRGFTSMSEKMEPEDVVLLLNEYLNTMVKIIMKHNGVIDKFIGDAIMALWGAPQATGTEPYDAVTASLEMREALVSFNSARLEKNKKAVRFGIGLHYGPCVSGIIGSEERLEYSVIGDTVNVCSRIESMTKSVGVDILVTSSLKDKVSDQFIFEASEAVTVKGKEKPIAVYKVNGFYAKDGTPVLVESPYANYTSES
jgi:adenylate cyclase